MLPRSALESVTHRIVVRRRLPSPFTSARIYTSSEGGASLPAAAPEQGRPHPAPPRPRGAVQPGDSVWTLAPMLASSALLLQ